MTSIWKHIVEQNHIMRVRYGAESCGSGRNFLGVDSIVKKLQVDIWVKNLLQDLFDRLEEFKEDGRKSS